MTNLTKVRQPKYLNNFRCIGSACEETCCTGTTVVIDKLTYEKYQRCADRQIKTIVDDSIVVNPLSLHDATFAFVKSPSQTCPFLSSERLCMIQRRLGEEYLSRTCATFPRAISQVDDHYVRSLYLACPEAARIALLTPDGMEIEEIEVEWDSRFGDFPTLSSTDPQFVDKPYRHFEEVSRFTDGLLRNRDYEIWERLTIIGMFCEQLNAMGPDCSDEAIKAHIQSYDTYVSQHLFDTVLNKVAIEPSMQLGFLTSSIEHRLMYGSPTQRFQECFLEFMHGVSYLADTPFEKSVTNYTDAYKRYYAPFMERHPYLIENYLINLTFRNLFPFGPQTGIYHTERSIYDNYLLFAVQYSMVRSLLIGLAGYHKDQFGIVHIVKLIQSFAKSIEHDLPYLKRLLKSLYDNELTNLALIAVLLKNDPIAVSAPILLAA